MDCTYPTDSSLDCSASPVISTGDEKVYKISYKDTSINFRHFYHTLWTIDYTYPTDSSFDRSASPVISIGDEKI